jgi:hypothetical protein
MNFKKPIYIILAIVALGIAITWNYIDTKVKSKQQADQAQTDQETAETIADLSNAKPADYDTITKEEYALSNTKALEVNQLLRLNAVLVSIGTDLQPSGVQTRYVYSTGVNAKENWIFTINQNSGSFIRSMIPREDYLGAYPVLDTKLWLQNYVAALHTAEKNGGSSWRDSNSGSFLGITMTLKMEAAVIVWEVDYRASDIDDLVLTINANTNALVQPATN